MPSLFSRVLKRRSLTFWVAFSLLMIVIVSKSLEWWYVNRIEANWVTVLQEKTETIISSLQSTFQKYQRETHEIANRISSMHDVRQSFLVEPDQRRLFILLEGADIPPDMNVEIYNRGDKLLAWWGTTAGLHHAAIDVQRETSFVSAGSVYSYLTVILPVMDGKDFVGSVVVHRLFDVNYPFSNRFISSTAFAQTFPLRLEFPAEFHFSDNANDGKRYKTIEIALLGMRGDTVGHAFVDEVKPSAIVEPVQRVFNGISSISLVFVSIIILTVVVRLIHRSSPFTVSVVGVSVMIWLVRYFWLWLDFPSGMFSQGIFDPRFFASPFGSGIAKSIGELLVTSVAGLATMVYLAHLSLPRVLDDRWGGQIRSNRYLRNFAAFLLIFPPAVLFVCHRGITAAIRSAVFDSTLQYGDPTSILPSFELAAMLLNLFLMSVAFILASVLFIVVVYRVVDQWFKDRFVVVAIGGIIFLAVGFLFGTLHPNPLVGHAMRILVVIATSVVAIVIYREGKIRWLPGAALVGVMALVLVVFQLDDQVHRREQKNIELLGVELTRPADAWMRYVLEQTLRDIRDESGVDMLVSGDSEKLEHLAFSLWSKSILSRVGYNCGVYVYDTEGHLVSNFRIGIRHLEPSFLHMSSSVSSPGGTQIRIVEHAEPLGKRKTYIGSTTALSSAGVPVGSIEVGISAAERHFLTSDMPPILQTYEREETGRYLRSLVVSEFIDGNLVYTTGEDIPHNVQLSDETTKRIQSSETLWSEETIGNSEYETYYLRVDNPSQENVILALGRRKADWRLHVFDFMRLVLFYFLVCTGLVLLVVGILALRGRTLALSFRAKLFLAIILVSLIPLLLIAYYNREIAIERANNSIVDRLTLETAQVRNRLLREFQSGYFSHSQLLQRVNDEWCEAVAAEIGTDFSVYVDAVKKASSKSELFQAEILDSRLSPNAFFNIALEGKSFFAENRLIGTYDYLVGYRTFPLGTDKREFAVLAVPLLYSQIEIAEDITRRSILLFGAYTIVLILIVIVGTIFANQISAPIRQLITATQRIAKGELDFRLKVSRKDEIGELHEAFNTMTADLQENRESLIKAEREMAWREMAKQVAHEIKNPLTPVKLSIQHLRQAFHDNDKNFPQLLEQVTKTAIEQIEALSRIASQFARFARMPEHREEDVDIQEVVSEAVKLFDEHKDLEMRFAHVSGPTVVRGDREELRRAFINILRNAVQAMNEKGTIVIGTEEDGEVYRISITDSGPGIPRDILPRLFEPNFSTKSEGMGLGLAIVKKTIDDHRGQIEVRSQIGKGTTVQVSLPKRDNP